MTMIFLPRISVGNPITRLNSKIFRILSNNQVLNYNDRDINANDQIVRFHV